MSTDTEGFSRNPNDYRPDPNGHFRRRKDERDIPPCVIQMAIEGGAPERQENGRIALETTYLGYDFTLVIDPEKQYVITAYAEDNW